MGVTGTYFVRHGLTLQQKESVALAIFMNISRKFESKQAGFPFGLVSTSGFSVEDLISNLLGFYNTVRPAIDHLKWCRPVSKQVSKVVWDTQDNPGNAKNYEFKPKLYPCSECKTKGSFPAQLQGIAPTTIISLPGYESGLIIALRKGPPRLNPGDWVRNWYSWDEMGQQKMQEAINTGQRAGKYTGYR